MNWWKQLKSRPFFIRLLNWEYWSSSSFYLPLVPYFMTQLWRHKHPFFFTIANPGLDFGGLGFESKYSTLQKIPEKLRPKSILVPPGQNPSLVKNQLEEVNILFPLIAKPDVGFRGFLVKKMDDFEQLSSYLKKYAIPFILQEFIDRPEEMGIFYYRFPNQEQGHISSLTLKEFLYVTGDGKTTLRELIQRNPRAALQNDRIQKEAIDLNQIPAQGKKVSLGIIGNHSKGTRFINGNHLINEALTQVFDELSREIGGFFYGRFDIKCDSFEALCRGEDFTILEINGVCSEPTHIYDAETSSYIQSLRDIKKHWRIVSNISFANHQMGIEYADSSFMFKSLLETMRYLKKVKRIEG